MDSDSYLSFLEKAPSLDELTEHINVGTSWYILGIMLKLDQKKLESIEKNPQNDDVKATKMFGLWLSGSSAEPNRRSILEALRKRVVGEARIADEYEKNLKQMYAECHTFRPSSSEQSTIMTKKDSPAEPKDFGKHEKIKPDLNSQPEMINKEAAEIAKLKAIIKEKEKQLTGSQNSDQEGLEETGELLDLQRQTWLTSPTFEECEKAVSNLNEHCKSIVLRLSSPEIVCLLLQPILRKESIKEFHIISTPLKCDTIKQFSLLSSHNSLQWLRLTSNSVGDLEVVELVQLIKHDTTLTHLSLSENPDITSASAPSVSDLIVTNRTLIYLSLRSTNICHEGIATLMDALKYNKTLKELKVDQKHKSTCSSMSFYRRLSFCPF
ncbi:PREDICTED: uncharacterized protein LOC109587464 isoform X2 [Amphimedon queenslandica]|uniref:Death domain-containing protein n=1 Tax=Amphimedon queenslandica TaxID=400682 RepID=A0AAN0JR09_AMPQE|nr:PREDICTED: uncharacterized protein LOC109587464 isoform X2 [Amphimedon queenslandica]|eukprot:XP_019859270.1 PREDICTED: uncharacterized protein LOC109587464 isoform X2 [Amphimedon queenslandica]